MVLAGIVLAIAAVIAIVAGVALAQRQGTKLPGTGGAHAGSGEGSAVVGSSASSGGASANTNSQGAQGAGSETSRTSGATGKPRAVPRPEAPVTPGTKVPTLTAPPDATIGMLVVTEGFKTATYRISFRPYGWGPGGAQGGRLVVRIDSSVAADAGAKAFDKDFSGRNAVVWVQGGTAQSMTVGGSFAGKMTVRRTQGDVGVLYLSDVSALK
jgi:hypothetical protein